MTFSASVNMTPISRVNMTLLARVNTTLLARVTVSNLSFSEQEVGVGGLGVGGWGGGYKIDSRTCSTDVFTSRSRGMGPAIFWPY